MDEIVLKALAKWPNVPACTGWLGLDMRGQWWMRDDFAQSLGCFTSSIPSAKGARLTHDKLVAFIGRNYGCEQAGEFSGAWFFQNGPQKVYVELEATPWVWRVQNDFSILSHTGFAARMQRCFADEYGYVYLETDLGFGLLHSQDMLLASQALEQGLWVANACSREELPGRFGYMLSPQLLSQKSRDAAQIA